MVTIEANGIMKFRNDEIGEVKTVIKGDKYVEEIMCYPSMMTEYLREQINNAENTIIPCYRPEAGSMWQALATVKKYYSDKDIVIHGELDGDDEPSEENVVY